MMKCLWTRIHQLEYGDRLVARALGSRLNKPYRCITRDCTKVGHKVYFPNDTARLQWVCCTICQVLAKALVTESTIFHCQFNLQLDRTECHCLCAICTKPKPNFLTQRSCKWYAYEPQNKLLLGCNVKMRALVLLTFDPNKTHVCALITKERHGTYTRVVHILI